MSAATTQNLGEPIVDRPAWIPGWNNRSTQKTNNLTLTKLSHSFKTNKARAAAWKLAQRRVETKQEGGVLEIKSAASLHTPRMPPGAQ
jgi:hypothetical protein